MPLESQIKQFFQNSKNFKKSIQLILKITKQIPNQF
jgi:hypothetical protein